MKVSILLHELRHREKIIKNISVVRTHNKLFFHDRSKNQQFVHHLKVVLTLHGISYEEIKIKTKAGSIHNCLQVYKIVNDDWKCLSELNTQGYKFKSYIDKTLTIHFKHYLQPRLIKQEDLTTLYEMINQIDHIVKKYFKKFEICISSTEKASFLHVKIEG